MPLIVVTGLPSSGKSTTVAKLEKFFSSKEKAVVVVSEEQLMGQDKNFIFSDSRHEKDVRGRLKSEVIRLLSKDSVVICDGLNYIKGFRYELFCASKASKTTQLTVQCDLSPADAENLNAARDDTERYSEEIFKALVQRYEAPISSNRWDAPLYLVLKDGVVNFDGIFDSLFNKKAPPPNMSTQNSPLSSTNFVYELDRQTQAVVSAIMEAQKTTGAGTEICIPGSSDKIQLNRVYTLSELARIKRQFLVYAKQKSCQDMNRLSTMFVQYLNANLTE
eukprot:TRINITY_DN5801_c0_g1_i1.p1 TRINITY_DN5801_c0_g1~~TRINITY_DN5801_c0_g1_i1.p1  ORF type:complete len:277 (-),score=81.18 TRINITY_DN5801_c0_g1_i1:21-851(-)